MNSQDEILFLQETPRDEDTQCGFWIFRAPWMQKLASKKTFAVLLGLTSCVYTASYMYMMGTITTMEKRFKIPSQQSGMLTAGGDIIQLVPAIGVAYVAAKGHRPRWIAVGLLIIAVQSIMVAFPHFFYGPGEDAIALTREYTLGNISDAAAVELKETCEKELPDDPCGTQESDSWGPQLWIFLGFCVGGVGAPLYSQLVTTYLDDNIKKSKAPMYISVTSFIRMVGPSLGLYLSSIVLQYYIDPLLTPVISEKDPRWMGAWWIGWIFFAIFFLVTAFLFSLFPKVLPRAAIRKKELIAKIRQGKVDKSELKPVEKVSWEDLKVTMRRILTNKVFIFNNLAAIFYCIGYLPFWSYQAKYIEVQYRVSASTANMTTGTVSLLFSSIGILLSGVVISRFKPKARSLALWNVFIGGISVAGIAMYTLNGCANNDNPLVLQNSGLQTCNADCNCDFVKYSPVCGTNNQTYISPCHAGCTETRTLENGTKIFFDCSCIASEDDWKPSDVPDAISGVCPVDCSKEFLMFFIILCMNKFIGGTEASSNFLLGIRCVDERDKTVSLGITLAAISLFAFIPSPILFGTLIDSTCILWGKTCGKSGNCWLYDAEKLRYTMNLSAAAFIAIATCLDIGTWYHSKHVKIFDDEQEPEEKNQELKPLKDIKE